VPNFRTLFPELEEIEPFQTEVVGYWATYFIHEKKLQYSGKEIKWKITLYIQQAPAYGM